MIPANPGRYQALLGETMNHTNLTVEDIEAWDDEGYPMVLDPVLQQLVRAAEVEGFDLITVGAPEKIQKRKAWKEKMADPGVSRAVEGLYEILRTNPAVHETDLRRTTFGEYMHPAITELEDEGLVETSLDNHRWFIISRGEEWTPYTRIIDFSEVTDSPATKKVN